MLSSGHVKPLSVIEHKKLVYPYLGPPNRISVDIAPYSLFSSFNLAKLQKITLKHVAEEAGVSRMTVSLALRGHAKISEATKKKVRRVADALGYVPNPHLSVLGAHIRSSKQKTLSGSLAYLCHTENLELAARRLRAVSTLPENLRPTQEDMKSRLNAADWKSLVDAAYQSGPD